MSQMKIDPTQATMGVLAGGLYLCQSCLMLMADLLAHVDYDPSRLRGLACIAADALVNGDDEDLQVVREPRGPCHVRHIDPPPDPGTQEALAADHTGLRRQVRHHGEPLACGLIFSQRVP